MSPDQIKFMYRSNPSSAVYNEDDLIVADSNNHCIRRLDLKSMKVSTIAGICGNQGFKDGPLGKNLLNNPTALGSDFLGNIWIYDEGNSYIRLLSLNLRSSISEFNKGFIFTMIKGVCRDLPTNLR